MYDRRHSNDAGVPASGSALHRNRTLRTMIRLGTMNNRCRIVMLAFIIAFASSGLYAGVEPTAALADAYFPKSAFSDLTYDSFLVDVFTKHLRQLAEPRLGASHDDVFEIRCLWMSPYKGDELIRIESRAGQKPYSVYKRAGKDRKGGVSPRRAKKI